MRSVLIAALLASTVSPAIAQTQAPIDKAAVGPVKPNAKNGPEIGDFGFDMAGRDTSVKPGTDFFDYANGTWYKATTIPADRSTYGMFHVLQDRSLEICDTCTRPSLPGRMVTNAPKSMILATLPS